MAAGDLNRLFDGAHGWSNLDDLPLVGMTLMGLYHDDETLTLLFPEGNLVFTVYGDCCSHTWIEDITAPAMGWGGVIAAVSDADTYRVEDDPVHDHLQFYQQVISTTKGDLVIEFRNSSNGYYGGSLTFSRWVPLDA